MPPRKSDHLFRWAAGLLTVTVLLVWGGFYLVTSRVLQEQSRQSADRLSGQIVTALQSDFLEVERLTFDLSQNELVQDFLSERDAAAYHRKSGGVKELVRSLGSSSPILEHLLLYTDGEVYYRFRGALSPTAARSAYFAIHQSTLPSHLSMKLEGETHVGYACGVYREGERLGLAVVLTPQKNLEEYFLSFAQPGTARLTLSAGGEVLASNDPEIIGLEDETLTAEAEVSARRGIGATPFTVSVYAGEEQLYLMQRTFGLAVLVSAGLFLALTVFFLLWQNRHLFRPMLAVMRGVEELHPSEGGVLAPTGERAFDSLVDKINGMVARLDESSRALRAAEAAQQRSLIISLKKQINAHFTVNVLNIIKLLAERREMEKVYDMCDGLSYLLRYANAAEESINGMEEFFVLQKYVDIMRIRYQDRFTADFEVDDRLEEVQLPRMLIQPVLENAILHGFQYLREGGVMALRAEVRGDCVFLEITDNGCGMSEETLEGLRRRIANACEEGLSPEGLEHVALPNIARRIASYYGPGFGLAVDSKLTKGTRVTITLGLHMKEQKTDVL